MNHANKKQLKEEEKIKAQRCFKSIKVNVTNVQNT